MLILFVINWIVRKGMEWKLQKRTRLCRSLLICTWTEMENYFTVQDRTCRQKNLLRKGK